MVLKLDRDTLAYPGHENTNQGLQHKMTINARISNLRPLYRAGVSKYRCTIIPSRFETCLSVFLLVALLLAGVFLFEGDFRAEDLTF